MIHDYIDRFVLTDEILAQHFNEAKSLNAHFIGLQYLHRNVIEWEAVVLESVDPEHRITMMGNCPPLAKIPRELVVCHFNWYAVTACNMVQLIGWIRKKHDHTAPDAKDYVKSVLPEGCIWRNNVAAHHAMHSPRSDDTDAQLVASVMHPLSFHDDAFYVGQFALTIMRSGNESTSSLQPWSLTKVHEHLMARYKSPTPTDSPMQC